MNCAVHILSLICPMLFIQQVIGRFVYYFFLCVSGKVINVNFLIAYIFLYNNKKTVIIITIDMPKGESNE